MAVNVLSMYFRTNFLHVSKHMAENAFLKHMLFLLLANICLFLHSIDITKNTWNLQVIYRQLYIFLKACSSGDYMTLVESRLL